MAKEIIVLDGNVGPRGTELRLMFLFPVAAPKQISGTNVVPSPTTISTRDGLNLSNLPPVAERVLTVAEKTAIDTGTLVWEMAYLVGAVGMTNAQLVAQVRAMYADRKAAFDGEYSERFRFAGARIDAV